MGHEPKSLSNDRYGPPFTTTLSFCLMDFLGVLANRLLFWFSFVSFVSLECLT